MVQCSNDVWMWTRQNHWTDFVSDDVVRSHTDQPLPSDTRSIRRRRLSFFGHLCCADTSQDHSRALQTCIWGPPKQSVDRGKPGWEWLRTICARSISSSQTTGRPRQTWLRTVEDNLRPLNFVLPNNRQTEANLVENGWRQSAPAQFWPVNSMDRSTWHRE